MKKIFLAAIGFLLVTTAFAVSPYPRTEALAFSCKFSGFGGAGLTIYDESPSAPSAGGMTVNATTEYGPELAQLQPGKQYHAVFGASGPSEFWLSFNAPKGYVLLLNNQPTDLIYQYVGGGEYGYDYTIELRPIENYQAATFGTFSGIDIGKSVAWDIALGKLRSDRSAGRIMFRDYDLTNSPGDRARLYYTAPVNSNEITVITDGVGGQTLRQVGVPQGTVDIVDDTGGYWFKFYKSADTVWGATGIPATFSGSPWKTVRIELTSSTVLKITETEGTVSQVSLLTFAGGVSGSGLGGTVTTSGGYNIHTFTSSGTFTATGNLPAEVFLVAGGGGGGNGVLNVMNGGGGGAGGVLDRFLPIASASYAVTVGAGGAPNTNGDNSIFFSLTAVGGGHGATGYGGAGSWGGSGGGEGTYQAGGPGYGTSGQGNNGAGGASAPNYEGGGGGGAAGGGAGANGGAGVTNSISLSAVTYAGGGGAGSSGTTGGTGGSGGGAGGGGSVIPNGGNAAANSGGGGGGGNHTGTSAGSGGSGIVIIKYPLTTTGIASGNYTWTLQEGDGSTWLRTTTHASTTYAGYRDEIVQVRTGGTTGTVVSSTRNRYQDFGWGEEMTQTSADPSGYNLVTTFDYYPASGYPITNRGNYRQLKSATTSDGNWTAYQYYDDWNRRGQLQYEFHPYLDAPSSVSFNPASGRVITTDYVADWTGRYTRPSLRTEYTNNVQTGQTGMTNGDNTGSGDPRLYISINSYSDNSGHFQTSYTEFYRNDASANEASRPYVIQAADYVQTSFAEGTGTFNTGTGAFTFSASGTYYRELKIHGSSNSSGATVLSSWSGQSFSPIYLIANKSTIEAAIHDPAGNIVRTERWIYTGGSAFTLLNYESLTYDFAGRLTQTVGSDGKTVNTSYTNGQVDSTVDGGGVRTEFTYDKIGRVLTSIKKGVSASGSYPAQVDLTNTYTYDGANHVTQTVTTGGSLSLTSTAAFDLAGRNYQSVANSGSTNVLTTGYAYTSGGRIVTTTMPGGATKTTENYLDGQFKQLYGTGVVSQYVTPFIDSSTGRKASQTVTAGLSANTVNSYWDWLGRLTETWKPDWNGTYAGYISTYNNLGQVIKYTQPGMAPTLYGYDTLGAKNIEGLDINGGSGTLDGASDDRITGYSNAVDTWDSGANWWAYSTQYTYAQSGINTTTNNVVQGIVRVNNPSSSLDLHANYDIYGNSTSSGTTVDRTNKKITTTIVYPDSSISAVQVTYNGLLMESTDKSGIKMTYGYDALGRQTSTVDPRTGTTTIAYIAGANLVSTAKDPANVTQATYTYDSAGRVSTVTNALSKVARYAYNDRNQKVHEWGDTTYPVEYVYDSATGQQTGMNTFAKSTATFTGTAWPTSPNNPQNTTWTYQAGTGLLWKKTDSAGTTTNTYTQARQVLTRTSPRGVITTYGYDALTGELKTVAYSNDPASTPGITYSYNRLGQVATVADATGTRAFVYNLTGTLEIQSVTLPNSFYGDVKISRYYDTSAGRIGRFNSLAAGPAASPNYSIGYTYEATTGRMNGVWGFSYVYVPNSNLIQSSAASGWNYTDTRTYNSQHDWTSSRVTTITGAATAKASFVYTPDTMGRITDIVKTGELFNRYGTAGTEGLKTTTGYNDRSELTSETTKEGTAFTVALPGRQDSYVFDNLGNRKTTNHNGTGYTWSSNSLNQVTAVNGSGIFDVAGGAAASSTVTVVDPVTGTFSTSRFGQYFFQSHAMANGSGSVWRTLTINAPGSTPASSTIDAFTGMNNFTSTYDADGNLTQDVHWVYTYDGEDRLISMQPRTALSPSIIAYANVRRLEFKYDYLGRRVEKIVRGGYNGTSFSTVVTDNKFVYDGWNVIEELNALSSNVPLKINVWGLDVSGTLQGAGGVGGLLSTYDYGAGTWSAPIYDAMGNVNGLINAGDGSIVAAYEYDAFGNTLRESGSYAASNPYRYSTKYADIETGLIYYGQRYYSSSIGRFINKDPVGESGGLNLYNFCGNNGRNRWDYLGQTSYSDLVYGGSDRDKYADFTWGDTYSDKPDPSWTLTNLGGLGGGTYVDLKNHVIHAATPPAYQDDSDAGDYGGVFSWETGSSSSMAFEDPRQGVDELNSQIDAMWDQNKAVFNAITLNTALQNGTANKLSYDADGNLGAWDTHTSITLGDLNILPDDKLTPVAPYVSSPATPSTDVPVSARRAGWDLVNQHTPTPRDLAASVYQDFGSTYANSLKTGQTIGNFAANVAVGSIGGVESAIVGNIESAATSGLEGAAGKGLVGVTEGEANALAGQLKGITVNGESAVSSVEAFGSRAGSTFRGAPTSGSDLDVFVTLDSKVVTSPTSMRAVQAEVAEIQQMWLGAKGFPLQTVTELDVLAPAVKAGLKQTPFVPLGPL